MRNRMVIYALLIAFFCISLVYGEGIRETPSKHSLKLGPNDDVKLKNLTLSEKVAAAWAEINNASFSGDVDIAGTLFVDDLTATTAIILPDGSAVAPALRFKSNPLIGVHLDGHTLCFDDSGNTQLKYDMSNQRMYFMFPHTATGSALEFQNGVDFIGGATINSTDICANDGSNVTAADFRNNLSLGSMALATATDYLENDGGNAAATVAFNNVSFATGTVSAPGLYPSGDPDTGFYSDAANSVSLAAGGNLVLKLKRGYLYQNPESDDITRNVSYDINSSIYRLNYSAYRGTLRIGGGSSEFAPARTIEFYSSATDSANIGSLTVSITDSVQKNHAPSDTARGIQTKIMRVGSLADSAIQALTSGITIGFVRIHNTTDGTVAEFLINTSRNETILVAQNTAADFSASKNNAGTSNVYAESNVIYLQNKRGGTRNYTLKLETSFD